MKELSPEKFRIARNCLLCCMKDKTRTEFNLFYEDDAFIIRTAAEMKPVNDFLENQGYVAYGIEIGDGVDELTHTGYLAYRHSYGVQEGFLSFYNNGASDYNKIYEKESCGGCWPIFLNYGRIIFKYRGKTEDVSLTFSNTGVTFCWDCIRVSWDSAKEKPQKLSDFDLASQRRAEKTATEIGRLLYGDNVLITST